MSETHGKPSAENAERIEQLLRARSAIDRELNELIGGPVAVVDGATRPAYILHETLEKLRHSELAQRQLAETQAAILNALPTQLALLDSTGVIVSVNQSWCQFAARNHYPTPDAGVGRNYLELCECAEGENAGESRVVAEGIRQVLSGAAAEFSWEYPCHSPTEKRWFRMLVAPLQPHQSGGAVVLHINITNRKLAEERLARINRLYLVLSRVNEAIVRIRNRPELFKAVCRIAIEQGLFKLAAVVGFDETGQVHPLAAAGADTTYFSEVSINLRDPDLNRGTIGTAISQKRCDVCNDTLNDPRMAAWREPFRRHGYLATASFPIIVEDTASGALVLMAGEEHYFQADELDLLTKVQNDLSFAVESLEKEEQRRLAEATLARVQQQQNLILESVGEGIHGLDREGKIVFENAAAAAMFGWRKDQMIGQPAHQLIHHHHTDGREHDIADCPIHKTLRDGQTRRVDGDVFFRQDRTGFPVEYHCSPIRDESGEITGAVVCFRDVSERKRAEEEIHRHSQTLAEVTSALQEIAVCNKSLTEVMTLMALRAQGLTQATGGVIEIVEGDDMVYRAASGVAANLIGLRLPRNVSLSGSAVSSGQPLLCNDIEKDDRVHKETSRKLGARSVVLVPLREGSTTVGVLKVISDRPHAFLPRDVKNLQILAESLGAIIQRRHAADQLRESEAQYRLLFSSNPHPMWAYDLETLRFIAVNTAALRHYGYTQEEFLGMTILDIRPPEDRKAVLEAVAALQPDGGISGQWRHRKKDGTLLEVEIYSNGVELNGRRARLVLAHDITERRRAEEKLSEQAALLDKARDAIFVRDLQHRILYWNQSAAHVYGWSASEIMNRFSPELLYPDPNTFRSAFQALLEKGKWSGELTKRTKSGNDVVMDCRWTLVQNGHEKPPTVLCIETDITERKKLEAQFLRAQRMDSIGTLAGGIAHDLNNVLAPILISVQVLKQDATNPETLEMLELLESSAKRGAALISQVLSFARGVEGQRIAVKLPLLLAELHKVLKEVFPRNVEMHLLEEENIWPVIGDPTHLHQVFLNLCVNARDAMPHGGKLTLSAENLVLDETYAAMNPGSKAGTYVLVTVTDTGAGIPPAILDKIFDPFFTTKEPGKGTGLGLSTVIGIIKSHGGFIHVYSEVGKGTEFKIYIPAHTLPAETQTVTAERTSLRHGNGQLILLVDDEQTIRETAGKTLERFGYRVVSANNGAEAIALYVQRQREIALVLTDVSMPIMDGAALVLALKALNPRVHVVVSSGLPANSEVTRALDAGIRSFVPKPYTAEVLLSVIQQELNRKID